MAKFTDEECKSIVSLRNSVEFSKKFEEASGNGYSIAGLWENIAHRVKPTAKACDVKAKYNELLKQYRKKKCDAKQSGGAGNLQSWKFWATFENELQGGAEIVAPNCLDSSNEISEANQSLISSLADEEKTVPETKRKKNAAGDKVLDFLREDSKQKFAYFEKLIDLETREKMPLMQTEELNVRVTNVESSLEDLKFKTDKIFELLEKMYADKK